MSWIGLRDRMRLDASPEPREPVSRREGLEGRILRCEGPRGFTEGDRLG